MFIKSCWIKFPYKGLLIRVQIRWDIFQTGRICCYQTSWRREGYFNLVLGFLRDMKNALSELICSPCMSLCRPGFEIFLFSCLFSVLFTLEYVTFCIPKHCALKEPLIQWLKVTLINVLLLFQGQRESFQRQDSLWQQQIRNYYVTDLELLAVLQALFHFKCFLLHTDNICFWEYREQTQSLFDVI